MDGIIVDLKAWGGSEVIQSQQYKCNNTTSCKQPWTGSFSSIMEFSSSLLVELVLIYEQCSNNKVGLLVLKV